MQEKQYLPLCNDTKLSYEITASANDKKDTIIILCHGLGTSMESKTNLFLKEYLRNCNISTFMFDFFGHGESSGAFEDLTISECVFNIESVVSFLKTEKGYLQVGIIGSSFGGLSSLMAVTTMKHTISALGLISPVTNPRTLPKLIALRLNTTTEAWEKDAVSFDENRKLKYTFCKDAFSLHYSLENINIPLILAHGADDLVVPLAESERIFWSRDNCFLLTVKNIEHGFQNTHEYRILLRLIASFVVDYI